MRPNGWGRAFGGLNRARVDARNRTDRQFMFKQNQLEKSGFSHLLGAVLGSVCLPILGMSLGCATNAAQNPHASGPMGMPVKVLEAHAVPVSDATEYVATLKSRDSAVIMPQVEGQITQIFVHSGDRVAAFKLDALERIFDALFERRPWRSFAAGDPGLRTAGSQWRLIP